MIGRAGDRAVVLGAGMAGLLAARALAGHYREVVIVERDELPLAPTDRRGAPQGRHVHALLSRGQQLLEGMFPGLTARLGEATVPIGDVVEDVRMDVSGHRLCRARSGLVVVSASRPLLEQLVRATVRETDGIRVIERCDVVGIEIDAPGRVTGVRLLPRADGSASELLAADLVVDAMGRASRSPAWLEATGHQAPPEERVVLDVAYATRRYRAASAMLDGDIAIVQAPCPAQPRGGALAAIEHDVAMLTLIGVCGDRPPLDPEGFDRFAASLAKRDIWMAIQGAEPVDDPVPHRFPASVWRRFDRVRGLPDGFIVIGDGLCSTNPIYGQGMTAAALQATTIARHLQRHQHVRGHRLRRELAREVAPLWQLAASADLAFPGAKGRRRAGHQVVARYVARVHAAAGRDPSVAVATARVAGLVDTPGALLHPAFAWSVLRRRATAAASDPTDLLPIPQ